MPAAILIINITFNTITIGAVAGIFVIIFLLLGSALISGSEVAFFSLNPTELNSLAQSNSLKGSRVLVHLKDPERLLATILISNNFINVAIVILGSYITNSLIDFENAPTLGFIIQVVLITFLLLLFGEVLPKVYAHKRPVWFASFMAIPLSVSKKIFRPLVEILVKSTSLINRKMAKRKQNISLDDLSDALDIAEQGTIEEKRILQGIVEFGNLEVKEIMKSRIDVVALDISTKFNKLKQVIIESGYSRIPIFEETIDNIKGVLYIKDLLPYIHQSDEFSWTRLLRNPFFIPESKKINDLLQEFQSEKIHLAIVIDEYGGASGLITLEDILEEIVGEITDESDEEEVLFTKLNDTTFLFEGKSLLNDFGKVFDLENDYFDSKRGESDTLAGLILELSGLIPQKNDKFTFRKFNFSIDAVDNRRIKRIKVELIPNYEENEND